MWQPVRFELKTCWNSGDEIFSPYCFVQEYLRHSHSSVRCGQYNVTGTWSMNLMEEIRDDPEPASRTRSCIFSSWAWYKQQKLTVGLLSFKFIIFWQTNICVSWNLAAQTGAAWKLTLGLVYVPSLTHWSWGSFGFLMKGFPLTLLLQEIIWSTLIICPNATFTCRPGLTQHCWAASFFCWESKRKRSISSNFDPGSPMKTVKQDTNSLKLWPLPVFQCSFQLMLATLSKAQSFHPTTKHKPRFGAKVQTARTRSREATLLSTSKNPNIKASSWGKQMYPPWLSPGPPTLAAT